MSRRPKITGMLSDLVAKRLTSQNSYWAAEVNFDKNTSRNRRIDFVGFKPLTPNYVVEPTSVELGCFTCYEIKSSIADYNSGHGLTFYGDKNYLVCTCDLAEELRNAVVSWPYNLTGILCPTKDWKQLRTKIDLSGHGTHRIRPASEMLWAICQSHDYDRNGIYQYNSEAEK
ncbi:hypothetical protein [Lacticaseibacillus paracasei]|uniref:hypothetical protein n=1 Tax=Lacticaseibacillus paracasei TaxID=1597 RepID=UPI000F43D3F8|nr:hypothetical protein [Lacticaseibacillus paracasei]RND51884.1 hypothetical protein FAM18113_02193 [Lacticaseibacillus paracasei]